MSFTLGVDPGAIDTGIVLLEDGRYVTHCTVSVERMLVPVADPDYLDQVWSALDLVTSHLAADELVLVAVEGLVKPTGQMGKIDPTPFGAMGGVIGTIQAWARTNHVGYILVRPGGWGSGHPSEYPRQMHDPRGACKQGRLEMRCNPACAAKKGTERHARSAYDVAREGRRQRRLELAGAARR